MYLKDKHYLQVFKNFLRTHSFTTENKFLLLLAYWLFPTTKFVFLTFLGNLKTVAQVGVGDCLRSYWERRSSKMKTCSLFRFRLLYGRVWHWQIYLGLRWDYGSWHDFVKIAWLNCSLLATVVVWGHPCTKKLYCSKEF